VQVTELFQNFSSFLKLKGSIHRRFMLRPIFRKWRKPMTLVDAGPMWLPDILPRVSLSVGSSSDSRGFRLYGTRVLLPENRQISGLCAPSRVRLGGAPRVRPIRVAGVKNATRTRVPTLGEGQRHYSVRIYSSANLTETERTSLLWFTSKLRNDVHARNN